MKKLPVLFFIALFFLTLSCDKGGDINIFSVQDDIDLGQQLRDEVLSKSDEYPVLDRNTYAQSYAYIRNIVNDILASGDVAYAEEFPWEIYLIDDDETLNAFAAPGGYIFVYSGLIKFLDEKDDFVGVLGHEMAHADLRHSTDQLTNQYGFATLLSFLLGEKDESLLTDILATVVNLKFSRSDETEADETSVLYLCNTEYAANGAASFFEKLQQQGGAGVPEFLSTHPSPENRVADINQLASEKGCDTTFNSSDSDWQDFKNSLP